VPEATVGPHPSAEQEHTVPVVIGAAAVITLLVFGLLVPWAARNAKRAAGWDWASRSWRPSSSR
jgi:hypothetical protein